MRRSRNKPLSMGTISNNHRIIRWSMPHLAKIPLVTRAPSTRKETFVKKFDTSRVAVSGMLRFSPSTPQSVPSTGTRSERQ